MWRPRAKSTVKIRDNPVFSFLFLHFQRYPKSLHRGSSLQSIKKSSLHFPPGPARHHLPPSLSLSLSEPEHNATPAHNKTTTPPLQEQPLITIPGADKRIVVYYTSLRVVRSTFEDCKTVQSILRGFRVLIDERDLSMDSSLLNELNQIFSGGWQITEVDSHALGQNPFQVGWLERPGNSMKSRKFPVFRIRGSCACSVDFLHSRANCLRMNETTIVYDQEFLEKGYDMQRHLHCLATATHETRAGYLSHFNLPL
ncbi:hypothetical protein NC651_021557 [Populus alba x Populus x berolinensis]|nr:hypothetical protein NC651_021557 [Populus alba x Populus x berolinensis]